MKKDTIISAVLIAGVGFLAFKFYKDLKKPKLGSACKFDSGPSGVVVYTFEAGETPGYKCRRCNQSGCASYKF